MAVVVGTRNSTGASLKTYTNSIWQQSSLERNFDRSVDKISNAKKSI